MKVYLAARFTRRAEMETIADILKTKGLQITARWVYGGEDGLHREDIAILDLEDVDACDIVVSFTEPYGSLNKGGGRHFEAGYGLAKGKRLVIIGDRENVFHHHPETRVYPDLDKWLHAICRE